VITKERKVNRKEQIKALEKDWQDNPDGPTSKELILLKML